MRVAVVGAGALGTFLASGLQRSGHQVTLLARRQYVERLRHAGLSVTLRNRVVNCEVRVADALSERPDVVVLAIKSQDVAAACEAIQPLARGVTTVTLQNGVRADGIAAAILGADAIVGGIVMCGATSLQPGVVRVDFPGWFIVGALSPDGRVKVSRVMRLLGSVVPTFATHNLAAARWTKLIGNLANGLSAASGCSFVELARSRLGRVLSIRVLHEGHRIVRAAGIQLDRHVYGLGLADLRTSVVAVLQGTVTNLLPVLPEAVSVDILGLAGRTSAGQVDFHGSTWQSLARGRPTEIDFLNGEITRLGARLGLPTPFNTRIVQAVHAAEHTQQRFSLRDLCPALM
jgi:2-dehydropantoate 2-reductase